VTVLATYNLKGGVGKTATAVNLAWLAARDGLRTVVWDLDPQGAATFTFRVRAKVKGGARGMVKGDLDVDAALRGTDHDNLDLLPADFRHRELDALLGTRGPRKKGPPSLEAVLGPLREAYDLVVLDCAPAIGPTSEAVFAGADALLVPLIPTTLSVRTLRQLRAFLDEHGHAALPTWPFFTLVDRRKKLHADIMASLPEEVGRVLDARVPYASDVERMGVERRPVVAFAPTSPASAAYRALWDEVAGALGV
jgi:chromosome partitioning protein